MYRSKLWIVVGVAGLLAPLEARADLRAPDEFAPRVALGAGAALATSSASAFPVFELAPTADMVWTTDDLGFGFAAALRTRNFVTFETSGGLTAFATSDGEFALGLSALAGYAVRRDHDSGPTATLTLFVGLRHADRKLAPNTSLYLSVHPSLAPAHPDTEVTAGVEVGGGVFSNLRRFTSGG